MYLFRVCSASSSLVIIPAQRVFLKSPYLLNEKTDAYGIASVFSSAATRPPGATKQLGDVFVSLPHKITIVTPCVPACFYYAPTNLKAQVLSLPEIRALVFYT